MHFVLFWTGPGLNPGSVGQALALKNDNTLKPKPLSCRHEPGEGQFRHDGGVGRRTGEEDQASGGGTTFSLNVNQPPCGLGGLLHEHLRLAFWPLLGDAPPGALQRKTVLCFGKRYLALVRPLKFPL